MAKEKRIGEQLLALADDYAAALDDVTAAAGANTTAALRSSLDDILSDLRRFYRQFLNEATPTSTDFNGNSRRPMQYSIKQATNRYGELVKISGRFLPEAELATLQAQYADDFKQAISLGGELQAKLINLVDPRRATPFAGPDPRVIKAGAERTSAFIRGEAQAFRDGLTRITLDGLAKGRGYKAIERDVRVLLQGAADPGGATKRLGLERRAELIARSELANAYVQAQKDYALAGGYSYVRWIATQDERTCIVCGSRHGRVFRSDEVTGTAHPQCRCVLAAVPNEAIDEEDPELRSQLLDQAFWDDQRAAMEKELAKANGWDASQLEARVKASITNPTASEKRIYPDIKTSTQPVDGLS